MQSRGLSGVKRFYRVDCYSCHPLKKQTWGEFLDSVFFLHPMSGTLFFWGVARKAVHPVCRETANFKVLNICIEHDKN